MLLIQGLIEIDLLRHKRGRRILYEIQNDWINYKMKLIENKLLNDKKTVFEVVKKKSMSLPYIKQNNSQI